MNDRELERSEARVEQERERSARAASAAVARPGNTECSDCGEPISEARRQAAPFAERCISCQRAHEREARQYA